jgi:chorismate dehydratase
MLRPSGTSRGGRPVPRPRVGHIQFLNCLPLYYGLVRGSGILDVDLVRGTPTELNGLLISEELDMGPISSIEYARHGDKLLLLDGPTVSCRGPVQSITLVSRRPMEKLGGRRIGLTGTSATSRVLLKVILTKRYGIEADYFSFGDSLDEALAVGDAALLIGDRALENLHPRSGLYVHDLGAEWHDMTGEGMVFAVWVARRDYAEKNGALVEHVGQLFRDSTEYFRRNLSEIARDASRWERYGPDFLEGYFRTLAFDFGPDLRRGLLRFYHEAASVGEVDSPGPLRFFTPEGVLPQRSSERITG